MKASWKFKDAFLFKVIDGVLLNNNCLNWDLGGLLGLNRFLFINH